MNSAADAFAIANLKARYCLAADLSCHDEPRARAIFADLFADDFVGDYGFGVIHGGQAIADFMCKAIGGGSEWMIHMLGSPSLRIDGDRADGDWTIEVESRRRDGAGLMSVVGRYADRFCRTADGWRIATINFRRFE